MRDDQEHVTCERFVDAISAMVDGEEPELDPRLVDAHVARCPDCAAFRLSAEQVRRQLRVREAEPAHDLSGRVASLAAMADRAASWRIPRVLLIVVGVEILVLSAIDLVGANGDPGTVHASRHLSAFTIAYGVLLLVVAARPARARTALPVAAVLAAALAITAVADLAAGRVPLAGEALHLPEIVSVVLIWLLAVPRPRHVPTELASPADRRYLRAVERDAS